MTSHFTLGITFTSTHSMSTGSRLARSLRLRPGPGLRVRLSRSKYWPPHKPGRLSFNSEPVRRSVSEASSSALSSRRWARLVRGCGRDGGLQSELEATADAGGPNF